MARLARRWILVFCQVEAAMKWRAAIETAGAVYQRTCQWTKPDGKPQYSGDRPGIGSESIVACYAPGRSTWNGGGSHGVFIVNKSGDARTGPVRRHSSSSAARSPCDRWPRDPGRQEPARMAVSRSAGVTPAARAVASSTVIWSECSAFGSER